jgi:demethylmenaquinone methyltransferase/2-methoxy-6-polyprenyl-1,4-benzoquinol methylase
LPSFRVHRCSSFNGSKDDKRRRLPHLSALKNSLASAEPEQVRTMFGSIAQRYDLANHVLSCGFDFYWRKRASAIVSGWQPQRILDLATGTGDLALVLQKNFPGAEVIGADFSAEMLEIAERKGVRQTILADARHLPFEAAAFDVVTIAFGLRNLPDWGEGLREMRRVLRPSGHVLILDFSLPSAAIILAGYRFYLHHLVPLVGSALTKKKNAYDYLGESIENFPSGSAMTRLMEENGFARAAAEPLTGGIVTIYTGAVPST